MGLITTLIAANQRKKTDDINTQAKLYTTIWNMDNDQLFEAGTDPKVLKKYALDNLMKLYTKEGGPQAKETAGPLHGIAVVLGGLKNLNPSPKASKVPPPPPEAKFTPGTDEAQQAQFAYHERRNKIEAAKAQAVRVNVAEDLKVRHDFETKFDEEDRQRAHSRNETLLAQGKITRERFNENEESINLGNYAKTTSRAAAGAAPRVLYGVVAGEESKGPQPIMLNPRNPNGYVTADGRPHNADAISKLTTSLGSTDRLFGQMLEISKIAESEGFARGTPGYDDRVGQIASALIGSQIQRAQQGIGVTQELSGIAGTGLPPPRTTPPGGTTPAAAPVAAPGTAPPIAVPPRPGAAVPLPASPSSAETDRFKSNYLDSLSGNVRGGGGAATQVGIMKGRDALRADTGLDPATFSVFATTYKDKLKGYGDTVLRESAMQRLNSVLNEFGDEVVLRAKDALQTGSPWLNRKVRDLDINAVDNPSLRRFLLAYNGFQRQYTTLTAGGALSRAMLPVSTSESVDKLLDPNATLKSVIESVDQVKIEGRREQRGFATAKKEILDDALAAIKGKPSSVGGGGTNADGGFVYYRSQGALLKIRKDQEQEFLKDRPDAKPAEPPRNAR